MKPFDLEAAAAVPALCRSADFYIDVVVCFMRMFSIEPVCWYLKNCCVWFYSDGIDIMTVIKQYVILVYPVLFSAHFHALRDLGRKLRGSLLRS